MQKGLQWKRPQLSLNINSHEDDEEHKVKDEIPKPIAEAKAKPKQDPSKKYLQLEETNAVDIATMSCEINSNGIRVMKEDFEIDTLGMKNISSGLVIVGNLQKEDLEMQEVIGNGACGYVYKAIHKPSGKILALKSINAFDKPKRH